MVVYVDYVDYEDLLAKTVTLKGAVGGNKSDNLLCVCLCQGGDETSNCREG